MQVKTLITPASSGKAPAEVTQIAVGRPDSHQIAVGHADGTVSSACCVFVPRKYHWNMHGHTSSLTAIKVCVMCIHACIMWICKHAGTFIWSWTCHACLACASHYNLCMCCITYRTCTCALNTLMLSQFITLAAGTPMEYPVGHM